MKTAASAFDDILESAGEVQILLAQIPEIARAQKSRLVFQLRVEDLRCQFTLPVVAARDRARLHPYFPFLCLLTFESRFRTDNPDRWICVSVAQKSDADIAVRVRPALHMHAIATADKQSGLCHAIAGIQSRATKLR